MLDWFGWSSGRELSPPPEPPGAPRRASKLPCAPAARGGKFRCVFAFRERGAVAPLSHFPPGHAGSERSSLPLFLRARQYATTGRTTWEWSAGLRPASRVSAKPAPDDATPRIARKRETRPNNAAPHQSHGCEPTHHHPRTTTWEWSAGQFSRWGPPTGIARERETRTRRRYATIARERETRPNTLRPANLTAANDA